MFPSSYFAATYFPGSYFAPAGAGAPPSPTSSGKPVRWFPGLMRRPRRF